MGGRGGQARWAGVVGAVRLLGAGGRVPGGSGLDGDAQGKRGMATG